MLDDAELIRLWHEDESLTSLEHRLGINLSKEWQRLKAEGKLPLTIRPSLRRVRDNSPDGRPSLLYEDPLLEALKRGRR